MKKFRFRLQRVLEYRHTVTQEKERELAIKNAELRDAEDGVDMIMAAQDKAQLAADGVMTMAELALRGEYLDALQQSLVNQRLLVIQATDAVEKAREAYREKAIEEETLETFKEKKLEEHKEDTRRDERKELNDLVVQRYRFKDEKNV